MQKADARIPRSPKSSRLDAEPAAEFLLVFFIVYSLVADPELLDLPLRLFQIVRGPADFAGLVVDDGVGAADPIPDQ